MTTVRKPPTAITRARFEELCKQTPPIRWHDDTGHTESFQLTSPPKHSVVQVYGRIGDHCFEFEADGHLSHSVIIDLCQNVLNEHGVMDD